MMRHLRQKCAATPLPVLTALVGLVMLGCANGAGEPEPHRGDSGPVPGSVIGAAELEQELGDAQLTPPEMLALTEDYEPRPVADVDETRRRLQQEDAYEPLAQALADAGWDAEERAQMVFAAAAHNSGQPYDSVRLRHQRFHDAMHDAVEQFERDLQAAERAHDIEVDREALEGFGVLTSFESQGVR